MSTLALDLPIAHAAHWYFLPLYVAPAVLVLAGAIHTALKERRKQERRQRWVEAKQLSAHRRDAMRGITHSTRVMLLS